MKTLKHTLAIAIIPLAAIAALVTTNGIAKKVERRQAAAVIYTQPGPEILGTSVSSVMNGLYAASGGR